VASFFCAHGKVKTTCAECKPRPAEPAALPALPSGRAPGPRPETTPAEPAGVRGPGKPLMPSRRRKRAPTREEAENAEAWWVKRS
jgi:hypothetical protein